MNTLYVTVSGFRWDESYPHVFKSTDLGENWIDISSNLPQIPINCILLDPEIPDAGVTAYPVMRVFNTGISLKF